MVMAEGTEGDDCVGQPRVLLSCSAFSKSGGEEELARGTVTDASVIGTSSEQRAANSGQRTASSEHSDVSVSLALALA